MRNLIAVILLLILLAISIPSHAPTVEEVPVSDDTEPTVTQPVEDPPLSQPWSEEEITVLAKMFWGEARGVPSDTEKAACIWCALNRVDQGYGSIVEVVTAPYQFVGYDIDNPIDDEIKTLCEDVLTRWFSEKKGEVDVGRVLPSDYLWFSGDGKRNHFRNAYRGGDRWDWSLTSPYES